MSISIKDLASKIAEVEGKKVPARIGEVREILSILTDLIYQEPLLLSLLFNNGQKRFKKRHK